jgi:hypothetical protein
LIHDAARGLPRAVNNLAAQALVAAWAGRNTIVDEHSTRAAITEITTDWPPACHHAHHGPPALSRRAAWRSGPV